MDFHKFYIALTCAILVLGVFADDANSCTVSLASDINEDCVVDFQDFALMTYYFDYLGEIYFSKLADLAENWLNCTMVNQADCWN